MEYHFEELPPRKSKRAPVKTERSSTKPITQELFENGRLKHYHSCSCGYTTLGCFNPVGAAKTLEFHIKIRHTR